MCMALKAMVFLVLALGTVGCASHRGRVDCEGHLHPINAPAQALPTGTHP